MANLINEARMFSENLMNEKVSSRLRGSSVSDIDSKIRRNEYQKVFSRYKDLKDEYQKMFSGYSESPLLSTQYFNATVSSYVSSFAGFMSIERDMDQPNGLISWMDVLGVTDYRTVVPNLGPDNFGGVSAQGRFEADINVTGDQAYTYLVGRKIIPGTLRIKITKKDGTKMELIDAGQGQFMSVAGVITASKIDYKNGNVSFTLATALTPGDDKCTIVGSEDVIGTPSLLNGAAAANHENRFLAKLQQVGISTVPDMLSAEFNIASIAAMKKSIGTDVATFLFTKLREIFTKVINTRLVNTLSAGYTGNTIEIDLESNSKKYMDYRSNLDYFVSALIEVESALAQKAVKGVTTTAYIAGANASNMFQKCTAIGKFQKNDKSTYINDLLGWYDGVPVLRTTDLAVDEVYAIHKTADGQMAPLVRGIYLPLTDTPTIGNYENPVQAASGRQMSYYATLA